MRAAQRVPPLRGSESNIMQRKGFTLTELLVSLAIIGLILAIVIPVLAASRAKSQSATCTSNLRQIGVMLSLYTSDNDGAYPGTIHWNWRNLMPKPLPCPTADLPIAWQDGYAVKMPGYGYNLLLAYDGTDFLNTSRFDRNIPFPQTTISVFDMTFFDQSMALGIDYCRYTTPCSTTGLEVGFRRHNGGANYLFVDGHVKWLPPEPVHYGTEIYDNGVKIPKNGYNDGTFPTFAVDPENGLPE